MAKRAVRNHPDALHELANDRPAKKYPSRSAGKPIWDPLHGLTITTVSNPASSPAGCINGSRIRGTGTRYTKNIQPKSAGQAALWQAMHAHHLTLALGPAGSGKTYLAISAAVEALEAGRVERMILCRPAIEAGETLGFLPGDITEKMAPFLRPLTDALVDRIGGKRLKQYMQDGTIEIAPIAYMRGRTLNNAFIVVDEAQNCTYAQLKMVLTRLGFGATMVMTGDPAQSDLLPGISGLSQIAFKLATVPGVGVVNLNELDILRHPLVAAMLGVL